MTFTPDVCDLRGGSQLDTVDKVRDQAQKIQDQLKLDYDRLASSKERIYCSQLRTLLAQCQPTMKKGSQWVIYNVAATYNVLADLFSDLKIPVPEQISRWNGKEYIWDLPVTVRLASLTMWDFLDPLTDHEPEHDYKSIRWDLIQAPFLVFQNGGVPRVKKFDDPRSEKTSVMVLNTKYESEIAKARIFGETILDGRYRLVGGVTLHGVSPDGEGGGHYTSYFSKLGEEGVTWYEYDDLQSVITPMTKLAPDTFREVGGRMPAMFFYERVGGGPTEYVPPPKPKDQPYVYTGTNLTYKVIHRADAWVFVYAIDLTPTMRLLGYLDRLNPTTIVAPNSRFWRIPLVQLETLEKKLKALDV